ncbi:MAG TPA: hypothetical protein VIZ86_16660 [Pseudomonas sp.]
MKHHDRIYELAGSIHQQVVKESARIAEAAIYSAVNRDLAQADEAGLMYAAASDDRPGCIEIVFHDRDRNLAGPDGWQSGPDGYLGRDPVLTLDPLWVANDLRAGIEDDYYDCHPARRARIEALERNLRAAADVLRRTLERVDIEAQREAAQADDEPTSITLAAVETDKVGTERLQLDVHLPLTIVLPRECATSMTNEQLVNTAALSCSGSLDQLRIALSMRITDLMERKP